MSLQEFVFGWPVRLAVVELSKQTRVSSVDILTADGVTPIKDIGLMRDSGEQGMDTGWSLRHEEWEQPFEQPEHC
jgi:hypothetical protein